MASVMQVLFAVPEIAQRYYQQRDSIFTAAPLDPTLDFHTQMYLFVALDLPLSASNR